MAERAVVMELVIPSQDENGKPLRLTKFQEHSIGDILRTLEHGAVVGVGTARGALLGDTMGAGKTIEAIVVVNTVPTFRRILVLCMVPAIEAVWVPHIRRWQTRDLRITPVHSENTYDIGAIPCGWGIMSYSLLRKHHDGLRRNEWDLIIIDEGQMLKTWNSVRSMNVFGGRVEELDDNPRSNWERRQREIKSLAGPRTKALILTGTPIKNRLDELFPLVNFLDPLSFPDIDEFEQCREPDWGDDKHLAGTALHDLPSLRSELRRTVLIRRLPSELQQELPPLTRKLVLIRHDDHDGDLSSVDTCPDDVVIMGLESNPVLQAWFAHMAQQIKRTLRELHKDDLSREEKRELEERLKSLLTTCRKRTGACKHNVVLSYLLQCQQKTVVFGWHRDLIQDLALKLRQNGRGVVTFIGGTKDPAKVVNEFQRDESVQFFIGNIDCASTSITLTAAQHVVLAELSWVPSDEDQSIARVWRTGQKQPVSVVKFLLERSLDERMQAAQDRKREFIAHALDGEDPKVVEL
jgi:SWI/SNF-related matrix-associated actin-dependent regulator of chromatin subfamily A-like protein 1